MNAILSNPLFTAIVVLVVGVIVWLGLSDGSFEEKKTILSAFTDLMYYFVLSLFGFNLVMNLGEIIRVPYRVLMFSAPIVWLATLSIAILGGLRYGAQLWERPERTKNVSLLFLTIGLVNHLHTYFNYSSAFSLRFVALFAITLVVVSFTGLLNKVNPLVFFLGFGLLHSVLMGSQMIIYFNFAFRALPLFSLFAMLAGLLYVQRRRSLSLQK